MPTEITVQGQPREPGGGLMGLLGDVAQSLAYGVPILGGISHGFQQNKLEGLLQQGQIGEAAQYALTRPSQAMRRTGEQLLGQMAPPELDYKSEQAAGDVYNAFMKNNRITHDMTEFNQLLEQFGTEATIPGESLIFGMERPVAAQKMALYAKEMLFRIGTEAEESSRGLTDADREFWQAIVKDPTKFLNKPEAAKQLQVIVDKVRFRQIQKMQNEMVSRSWMARGSQSQQMMYQLMGEATKNWAHYGVGQFNSDIQAKAAAKGIDLNKAGGLY